MEVRAPCSELGCAECPRGKLVALNVMRARLELYEAPHVMGTSGGRYRRTVGREEESETRQRKAVERPVAIVATKRHLRLREALAS